MADLDCKTKMASSQIPSKSIKISDNLNAMPCEMPKPPTSLSVIKLYEHYLRLPELRDVWRSSDFPDWKYRSILRPALQALEITFRFISTVMSDPRGYTDGREWRRRLESLATRQIEVIAILCELEEEDGETVPLYILENLTRESSSTEVWKLAERANVVVNRTSDQSLLPRLASWKKSEDIAQKIMYSIECEMRRCPYTLGLGEPNLTGKPSLRYDAVCEPSKLHSLKKSPSEEQQLDNRENQTLYTALQILESWIHAARNLLARIVERIDERNNLERASSDCWLLERIWKLLAEIEDLCLLMDPDDFLRLKNQLSIKSTPDTDAFCFRSEGLIVLTKLSKDLKHKVPWILEVEADPKGGPRIQEAAMKLYREKQASDKIHLLEGLQAIECSMKKFFFAYRQMLMIVMGSLEATGNRTPACGGESCDSLSHLFLESTYFPSLDAAKTFLGDFWERENGGAQIRQKKRYPHLLH